MNFTFSEEQEAVRELAAQILADRADPEHLAALERDEAGDGYDPALWRSLGEANLLGVAIPEADGGSGYGLGALQVLLEEAGRVTAPVPLLPTLVYGALPIARFGSPAQREALLPGVVSGDVILTAALEEAGSSDPTCPTTRVHSDGSDFVLRGEKVCVPAAEQASRILVPARHEDGRVGVFLLEPGSEGIVLERGLATNYERQYRVTLEDVRLPGEALLGDLEQGAEIVAWLALHAQTAICALQLGVSEAALKLTAEYTAARKQFGRPIATFQAVTMRSADAFVDIECMKSTLWQAVYRLESDLPATAEVAAAKWWACRGGQRVAHAAQHLHGGTGADIDYPVHRFFLWAKQLELTLGGAGQQLMRIGEVLAKTG